jgi:hypothetical protein
MKKKLTTTTNCLFDIIEWLKEGYIVSLYSSNKSSQFYFSNETIDEIKDEVIIYINLDKDPTLMEDSEWPWYIKNEGFVDYVSLDKLPTDKDNIYSLKL